MEIVTSIVQARVGESGSERKEAKQKERKFTPLHFGFVVRWKVDTYNGGFFISNRSRHVSATYLIALSSS